MPAHRKPRPPNEQALREATREAALRELNESLQKELGPGEVTREMCEDLARARGVREDLAGFDEVIDAHDALCAAAERLLALATDRTKGPMATTLLAAIAEENGDAIDRIILSGREVKTHEVRKIPRLEDMTERQWFVALVDGIIPGLTRQTGPWGLARQLTSAELALVALAGGDFPENMPTGALASEVRNTMAKIMRGCRKEAQVRIAEGRRRAPAGRGKPK